MNGNEELSFIIRKIAFKMLQELIVIIIIIMKFGLFLFVITGDIPLMYKYK